MAPKHTRSTIVNNATSKGAKISADSCVIPGCTAITERSTIVLFSMAFGDLVHWWKSTAWVNKYQVELPDDARICEVHFEEHFIDRTRKNPRLFVGTVPTLKLGVLDVRQGLEEKPVDIDYYCRLCAKKQDNPLKFQLGQLTNILDIVACCIGKHKQQSELPNGVCANCIAVMRKFEQFVKKCDEAQKQLLKIGNEFLEPVTADKENTTKNTEPEFELVDLSMDAEESALPEETVQKAKMNKIPKIKQRCIRCDKDFTSLTQYRNHLKSGHNEKGYKCQVCDKKFSERDRLRLHLEKVHENRRYKCTVCNRYFNWQCSLKLHMKIHQYKFNCDDCWRAYPTQERLDDHKLMHEENKQFKCLECGAKFKLKWRLEQHKERTHNAESTVKKYEHTPKEETTLGKQTVAVVTATPVIEDTSQIDLDEEKLESIRAE